MASLHSTGRALSLAAATVLSIAFALLVASPARADQVGDHQVGDLHPQASHSDREPQASHSGLGTDPAYPGSVVHVSVSGPLQAGKVLTITATGTNAADNQLGVPISYGLELIVVDPEILKGPCEVSEEKEISDITNVPNGGQLLNFSDLNEGPSGSFKITQPYEPGGFGPLLVCAYSKFVTDDAAYGSTEVRIAPAAKGNGKAKGKGGGSHSATARPNSVARPVVTRSHGGLSCSRGRWSNRPTQFTYRWKLGSGAFGSPRTSSRLTLRAHSPARTVVCSVTASNAKGSFRATSAPFRLS
jgi:hypothetical protein